MLTTKIKIKEKGSYLKNKLSSPQDSGKNLK